MRVLRIEDGKAAVPACVTAPASGFILVPPPKMYLPKKKTTASLINPSNNTPPSQGGIRMILPSPDLKRCIKSLVRASQRTGFTLLTIKE
jgi:hypothetical protein